MPGAKVGRNDGDKTRISVMYRHPGDKVSDTGFPLSRGGRSGAPEDMKRSFVGGVTAGTIGVVLETVACHLSTDTKEAGGEFDCTSLVFEW